MTRIRYACVSDLHFGASNSLLTHVDPDSLQTDVMRSSPVLSSLLDCLGHLLTEEERSEPPTLILNGDVLDLALSTTNEAASAFERMVEGVWPRGGRDLFARDVWFLPGNHDHHLWMNARETQYVRHIGEVPIGQELPPMRHATPVFETQGVPSTVLTQLARRHPHLADVRFHCAYPNFGLSSPDGERAVVFHHGLYIESIYLLQTRLIRLLFPNHQMPEDVEGIEAENFAWIDYFWSVMGRSGAVGKDVNLVYDKLQDAGATKKLLATMAKSIVEHHKPHTKLRKWMEEGVLEWILDATLGRVSELARNQTGGLLGQKDKLQLQWYLKAPLRREIERELGELPSDFTFVFGHTHKPFCAKERVEGYEHPVKLFNTGGWVVDTPNTNVLEGGAVVLIDEDLNVVSLRMYNEAQQARDYRVRVEDTVRLDYGHSPLYEEVERRIEAKRGIWSEFSRTVAVEVDLRMELLRKEIRQPAEL